MGQELKLKLKQEIQFKEDFLSCLDLSPKLSEVHRVGSVIYCAKLNGVKAHRHLKPSTWKERALRMSFKSYNISALEQALSEQSMVKLRLTKSFNGSTGLQR